MKDVAVATLNHFQKNGLNVLRKNQDGTVTVVNTKIGKTEVNAALKEWGRREDGTGYSPEARRTIKEAQTPSNDPRPRIQEE